MKQEPLDSDQFAAIDMGSNSFHMVVARFVQNTLQVQESISEKVQLAGSLDENNKLTAEVQVRALACLARLSQRIAGIPKKNVRVVGTNALRVARNSYYFLKQVESLLGHPVEIIAGREEARLIYLGVSHSLADDKGNRLVIDIGGGSTEFIIGRRFEPIHTESLHIGCISYRQRFFADGKLDEVAFDRAVTGARLEIRAIEKQYRETGWQSVVGASGTIKAIEQILLTNQFTEESITLDGLLMLKKQVLQFSTVDELVIEGLKPDRASVFTSGLAILIGIFKQLGLTQMRCSSGALREGVLYDLLGRFQHEDVRDRSTQALMARYYVAENHAERVCNTALKLYDQLPGSWMMPYLASRDLLRRAALLHEIGLAISHTGFHKHGSYLLRHSDLPGFSRQEQELLALLVRGSRRKIALIPPDETSAENITATLRLTLLLRLAVVLHHSRSNEALPSIHLAVTEDSVMLRFPDKWLDQHPLTREDFAQEANYFEKAGYSLSVGALTCF